MTDEPVNYGLIVAFPDPSSSFVNGFAAGQIWEAMDRGDGQIQRTVTTENEEVIRRMAGAKGYSVDWFPTTIAPWVDVTLTVENTAPVARPNPHGIRLVAKDRIGVACRRCDGLGRLTADSIPCSACGGSGEGPD